MPQDESFEDSLYLPQEDLQQTEIKICKTTINICKIPAEERHKKAERLGCQGREKITHFKGPGALSTSCMLSSSKTEGCKTDERRAAIEATLRLLQFTCKIQEEWTNCHII